MWFTKENRSWEKIPEDEMIRRLSLPKGKLDMVLDTDTYNEVDDQFALAYSLLSPERLHVEAIYAAPFYNDRSTGPKDGMERSYNEIVRLLGKIRRVPEGLVHRGADQFMPGPDTPGGQPGRPGSDPSSNGPRGRRPSLCLRHRRLHQHRLRPAVGAPYRP